MGEDSRECPSGCAETKAHNISRRQKEDRGGCTCTLGEIQSGEKEIGGRSRERVLRRGQL
jgi:hypothetical protein